MIGFAQQAKHTAVQDAIRSLATVYESAEVFVRTSPGLNRKKMDNGTSQPYTLVTIDSDEQGVTEPDDLYSVAMRERMKANPDFSGQHPFQLFAMVQLDGSLASLTVYYSEDRGDYYSYSGLAKELSYCKRGTNGGADSCSVVHSES